MIFCLKSNFQHWLFEYIQTEVYGIDRRALYTYFIYQDSTFLVDCQIFGHKCSSDTMKFLLSAISPVLRSAQGWDGVILADLSSEDMKKVLEFFYTGRYSFLLYSVRKIGKGK